MAHPGFAGSPGSSANSAMCFPPASRRASSSSYSTTLSVAHGRQCEGPVRESPARDGRYMPIVSTLPTAPRLMSRPTEPQLITPPREGRPSAPLARRPDRRKRSETTMERLPGEVRDTILVMLPGFGAMLAVSKGWREQVEQLRDRAYQVLCEWNLSRGNVAHPSRPSPNKCAELLAFGIADKYLEKPPPPPPPPPPPSPPPMQPMYVPNVPGSLPVYVPTSPIYSPTSPDYSPTSPGYYSA